MCHLNAVEVNKRVLMTLIGRLHDDNTKQVVLSNVKEMTLDDKRLEKPENIP